jgi:nitrite reductase (NO-forming) / hydroxylamine reductase
MEFNADGTEVWVSAWNMKDSKEPNGEIVVYDADTLEEKARIKGLSPPPASSTSPTVRSM